MANPVDESELLGLPNELDDIFLANERFFNSELGRPTHSFPTEFPYEFNSFGSSSALSSPVESVVGSAETESSDEEEFFAGLTQRLTQFSLGETQQKKSEKLVMSGSPQSTLSGLGGWSFKSISSDNGSPNGICSPPTTAICGEADTWDLIYQAAGQVARLKMFNDVTNHINSNKNQIKGLLGNPNLVNPNNGFAKNLPYMNQYSRQEQVRRKQLEVGGGAGLLQQPVSQLPHQQPRQQMQGIMRNSCGVVDFENGMRPLGLSQTAWPPLQARVQYNQLQKPLQRPELSSDQSGGMRAVFLLGSGVKRESAGTGVFLPRRYSTPPIEPRKKSGCSTVLVPVKVVQALNLNLVDLNGGHPRVNHPRFVPSYDDVLARKNAILAQQSRNLYPEAAQNHEIRLPQEWSY